MNSLLIVDGSSLIASSYYGNPETDPPSAKVPVNAIFPFLMSLFDILKEHREFTHVAVVFDKTRMTFRRQLDPTYKAGRPDTPDPLARQDAHIREILKFLGFRVLSDQTYEADDIACSIATKAELWPMPVTAWTRDNDWVQFVTDNTTVWITEMTSKAYDAKTDITGYIPGLPPNTVMYDTRTTPLLTGLRPEQIPDMKGLAGCSSDEIQGIRGIGRAAAVPLLQYYGNIENIYEAVDDVSGDRIKEKRLSKMWREKLGMSRSPLNTLKGQEDTAIFCRYLATIRSSASVPLKTSDYIWTMPYKKLERTADAYGLPSLMLYADLTDKTEIH